MYGHFPIYRVLFDVWSMLVSSDMNEFQRAFNPYKHMHLL